MNRFLTQTLVAGMMVALVAPSAVAKDKKKDLSANPLAKVDSKQPDKELYDKAMQALKKGRFDVARLDLQTLLNTYPESEYQMRAKLSIGDSWFKEGGTAALTQAEAEYKDFITFFPQAPEAAEAQMKVADIYYMQMEKPDRDFNNTVRAEQEYRNMIQQFPESSLIPRAKQRLREVQEVMAEREYQIGAFYASHENWDATIARLQTIEDTYPLYSHSDQVLLTLGDAYEAIARQMERLNIAPAAKKQLVATYDDRAAAAYTKVIMRYPMAPHVEEARDRLVALNRQIPEPTQEAIAASDAEERSRVGVRLTDRMLGLVKHGPSMVEAPRVGEPTLDSPARTLAPQITQAKVAAFKAAISGQPAEAQQQPATAAAAATSDGTVPPRTESPAAPLTLENPGEGSGGNAVGAQIIAAPSGAGANGSDAGNGAAQGQGQGGANPTGAGQNVPASGVPATPEDFGIKQAPPVNAVLPPAEKPAEAPPQVNDVKNPPPAQVNTGAASSDAKKAKKPAYDSSAESSSKKKKKKGLDKINPF
jgi:outer membrane protein assembly factor BamD